MEKLWAVLQDGLELAKSRSIDDPDLEKSEKLSELESYMCHWSARLAESEAAVIVDGSFADGNIEYPFSLTLTRLEKGNSKVVAVDPGEDAGRFGGLGSQYDLSDRTLAADFIREVYGQAGLGLGL